MGLLLENQTLDCMQHLTEKKKSPNSMKRFIDLMAIFRHNVLDAVNLMLLDNHHVPP